MEKELEMQLISVERTPFEPTTFTFQAHNILSQAELDQLIHKSLKNRPMVFDAPPKMYLSLNPHGCNEIKNVIFNDPATIVFWGDGTKTVVKAVNEPFDPEKGLSMAIAKRFLGDKGNYYNTIRKWIEKYKPPELDAVSLALKNLHEAMSSFLG